MAVLDAKTKALVEKLHSTYLEEKKNARFSMPEEGVGGLKPTRPSKYQSEYCSLLPKRGVPCS